MWARAQFGLAVQIVENVAIAAAFSKTEVFAAISLGALAMVTFPAISSLKANHVGAGEQGQIQGALVGAQSLAGGLGPLLFSYIFKLFSTCDHARPSLKTQTLPRLCNRPSGGETYTRIPF
jgi:MFS family permease